MRARPRRPRGHSHKDRQNLAAHIAIAEKIVADPTLVNIALNKLEARYRAGTIRHSVYIGWFVILELVELGELDTFVAKVSEVSPYMDRLRRRSPLLGLAQSGGISDESQ